VFGERPACVAREISKKFEEFLRGPLGDLVAQVEKRTLKGEMVIVVEGLSRRISAEEADPEEEE
jgi:16S rRNA (cytidine1402-2'-O)-methyltransferase